MTNKKVIALIMSVFFMSAFIAGCGSTSNSGELKDTNYNLDPLADMPVEVQSAPVTVKQAYQFAVANPDILSKLPCYCGCGGMGHTSNYSCYLAGEDESGNLTFDGHALGCSICVDITQDAMRMLDKGKS
ncbi:MAG: PCYCGC motif-containing (lipo)protein, partial [Anaerolineales bacterium]